MSVLDATPLPRIFLSGKCDASGNAVVRFEAPAHFYAQCYIAVGVSVGAPAYTVQLGTGQPLSYAGGAQANIGPFLLNPGERAQLVVTGASANATISGQVMGIQASDPIGLVTALPVQATTVNISGPVTVGGSVTITSGSVSISGTVTVAGSVSISSGTVSISGTVPVSISSGSVTITGTPNVNILSQSVQIATNQPQKQLTSGTLAATTHINIAQAFDPTAHVAVLVVSGAITGLTVTGQVTGIVYVNVANAPGPVAIPVAVMAGIDTGIVFDFTSGGVGINYWIEEVLDTQAPILTAIETGFFGANVPVTINDVSKIGGAGGSLAVAPLGTWAQDYIQSVVFDNIIAGNGTLDLVAAVASQYVYCIALNIDVVTAGATTVNLEDDNNGYIAKRHCNVISTETKQLYGATNRTTGLGHKTRLRNLTAAATGEIIGELLYVQKA